MRAITTILLAVATTACAFDDVEQLSTTEQAIGETASVIASLNPQGYWRLGETSGSTAYDSSAFGNHGDYGLTFLGAHGAINGDSNTAASFASYASGEVSIPDNDRWSLTRDWDFFQRSDGYTPWGKPWLPAKWSWGYAHNDDPWVPQVSQGPYYYLSGDAAYINPSGQSGTFQQARPTTLMEGEMQIRATWSERAVGGPLQPVALVAQATDLNNFVRAELVENADHTLTLWLIRTINGNNEYLASANVGYFLKGDWWFVRFHFDRNVMKARAWKYMDVEPSDDVCGPTGWQVCSGGAPTSGFVAVRSANSNSTVQPIVTFDEFWVQTTGFTISTFIWAAPSQPATCDGGKVFPLGKANNDCAASLGDDDEYYMRYHPDTKDMNFYVFNRDGGKGAGVDFVAEPSRWYHVVMMLDPGDYHDTKAGATMYVDGVFAGGAPSAGGRYRNVAGCVDVCTNYSCTDAMGQTQNCWTISPLNHGYPLQLGTSHDDIWGSRGQFAGMLDEVAVFDRKLTESEIKSIFNTSCQPNDNQKLVAIGATATSTEGSLVATNAIDGNFWTRWSSVWSDPQSITIDLGFNQNISRLKLFWETAYSNNYTIQIAGNSNIFTNVVTVTPNGTYTTMPGITNGDGGLDVIDIFRTARKIRIRGNTRATGWGYSLWEVEMYGCRVAP